MDSIFTSWTNTFEKISNALTRNTEISQEESTSHVLLQEIKQQADHQESKSVANCLNELCGEGGRAEINEFNGNFQIQLFFDSEKKWQSCHQLLVKKFSEYRHHSYDFEEWQIKPERNLYTLKLKANQSVALLGKNPRYSSSFEDGQELLRSTKEHLNWTSNSTLDNSSQSIDALNLTLTNNSIWNKTAPTVFFVPQEKNIDFIKVLVSWLPLKTLSHYARTCTSTLQFIMNDQHLWGLFAIANKIQLIPSIHPKLQVMGSVALEKAKFFEEAFDKEPPSRFKSPETSANYAKAVNHYIQAAELGNAEARNWLASLAATGESTLNARLYLVLGDIYSKEENKQELAANHHARAWALLTENAENGCHDAIQLLSGRSIGEKSVKEINDFLDVLLQKQIRNVSAQGQDDHAARRWILSVFSSANLPPAYQAKKEEALLSAVHKLEFNVSLDNSAWNVFRYEFRNYDSLREAVGTKLNKMLGIEDHPIKLHFFASSLNHHIFVIHPENKDESNRFAEAVKKSILAPFFSSSTNLGSNMMYKNCLKLDKESWNQFKALLSK